MADVAEARLATVEKELVRADKRAKAEIRRRTDENNDLVQELQSLQEANQQLTEEVVAVKAALKAASRQPTPREVVVGHNSHAVPARTAHELVIGGWQGPRHMQHGPCNYQAGNGPSHVHATGDDSAFSGASSLAPLASSLLRSPPPLAHSCIMLICKSDHAGGAKAEMQVSCMCCIARQVQAWDAGCRAGAGASTAVSPQPQAAPGQPHHAKPQRTAHASSHAQRALANQPAGLALQPQA